MRSTVERVSKVRVVRQAVVLGAICAVAVQGGVASAGPGGAAAVADDPVRVIVVADLPPGAQAAAAAAREQVGRQGGELRRVYRTALRGYAATVPSGRLAALRAQPGVHAVELDQRGQAADLQDQVPSWGLDRIDQLDLPLSGSYAYDTSGAGVTTYVFDSGVRLTHQEFTGRIRTGPDYVDDDGSSDDCNGHGTHVAGTAAGSLFGVAKAAEVVAVRVLDCDGRGWYSDWIAAVDWINADHQAGRPAVVNASLGGGYSDLLNQAVRSSIEDGVVWTVAALNQASDACSSSPASVREALTVGATDSADRRASFSNVGSCVDLFAPGVDITSAGSGSDAAVARGWSGTSMAAPHVAGAVARYLSTHPSSTPAQAAAAVLAQATVGRVSDAQSANVLLHVPAATGVPGAPGSVTALTDDAHQRATLSWSAPATDGGSEITGYRVARTPHPGGAAGQVSLVPATDRAFTFIDLVPGASYALTVQAVNSVGPGAEVSKTVTLATPPGPPVIGTASQGSPGGVVTATARWSPPSSTGGSTVTGYVLRARQQGTATVVASPQLAPSLREYEMRLPTTGSWTFTAQAVNVVGASRESASSNAVRAR